MTTQQQKRDRLWMAIVQIALSFLWLFVHGRIFYREYLTEPEMHYIIRIVMPEELLYMALFLGILGISNGLLLLWSTISLRISALLFLGIFISAIAIYGYWIIA